MQDEAHTSANLNSRGSCGATQLYNWMMVPQHFMQNTTSNRTQAATAGGERRRCHAWMFQGSACTACAAVARTCAALLPATPWNWESRSTGLGSLHHVTDCGASRSDSQQLLLVVESATAEPFTNPSYLAKVLDSLVHATSGQLRLPQ